MQRLAVKPASRAVRGVAREVHSTPPPRGEGHRVTDGAGRCAVCLPQREVPRAFTRATARRCWRPSWTAGRSTGATGTAKCPGHGGVSRAGVG
eukprot:12330361-Heterocapsa_arctica.AAC.1